MTTLLGADRLLGSSGPAVFPLSLGCMGMSGMYGPADASEGIATIHAALDHGVTLLDTGDFYGMGHNEMLIGRALRDRRGKALLSVKFGALRGPDAAWLGFDARPVAVKNFLAHSLTRLGVAHRYEEFPDDHSSVDYRMDESLPFLAQALSAPS